MKTKKIILGLGIALLGNFAAHAQGLEGIIVEKYYKANAADAAGSVGTLPVGSVTYRIYADLAAGYKFQAIYGSEDASHNPLHILKINTTTSFFNAEDRGATTPNGIATAQLKNNTNALDSWFSVGAAAAGEMGVLKSEDDGATNFIAANTILKNNVASIGIPLTTQDGMVAGSPEAVTFVGLTTETDVFNATSQAGNSFVTQNGSIASLNGSTGPLADNKVLIGQFTTDGIFHFELNIQIGNGTVTENYVTANPTGSEQQYAALNGTFGTPPTIALTTAPANGGSIFSGNPVTMSTVVGDIDGTVVSVQFFDGATSLGTVSSAPFTFTATPTTAGGHSYTAKATDNDGNTTTSTASAITVNLNTLPATAITGTAINPVIGGVVTTTVTITATATDVDGPIDSVAFMANGVRVGSVAGVGPYSFDWITTARGAQSLTTKAYDQQGGNTTSAVVSIVIPNPNAKPYYVKNTDTTCVVGGICLPINAKDSVINVIGFDMVLHYDKTKVSPTGTVSAGTLVNPNYVTAATAIDAANGKMIITVSLNNAAPTNTRFYGVGELICVGFNKTAAFGSIDTAMFTIDSIVESRYTGVTTILVDAGKYITHKDSTLHAALQFWADNSALHDNGAGVVTNIYANDATGHTHKTATAVHPDVNGLFTEVLNHTLVNGGVSLEIDRDIAGTTSVQPVVNGFDALLTRKVVVSDLSFIPTAAQMVAMDVNMDGKISAGDVSQLNERSVLSIAEFKQAWNYNANGSKIAGAGNSKDWVFIDGTTLNTNGAFLISSVFPFTDGVGFSKDKSPLIDSSYTYLATAIANAASCPVIGSEVYTGILLGDVNGNFKSVSADGVIKSATTDKIIFDLSNAVANGDIISIPVSIVSDKAINALDFALQLDGGVTYNSIVNNIASLTAMDNLNADDATLRFTSYSLANLDLTKPVVSVNVKADEVNKGDLKSLVGYLNGDQVNVEVVDGSVIAGVVANNPVTVYPNPASTSVNVLVTTNSIAQLTDMEGNVVITVNVSANQAQAISTANLANGVYTLKVANASFVQNVKVVIAK